MTAMVFFRWECGRDIAVSGFQDRERISRRTFGGDVGYELLIWNTEISEKESNIQLEKKILTIWIGSTFLFPSLTEVHGQEQAA